MSSAHCLGTNRRTQALTSVSHRSQCTQRQIHRAPLCGGKRPHRCPALPVGCWRQLQRARCVRSDTPLLLLCSHSLTPPLQVWPNAVVVGLRRRLFRSGGHSSGECCVQAGSRHSVNLSAHCVCCRGLHRAPTSFGLRISTCFRDAAAPNVAAYRSRWFGWF